MVILFVHISYMCYHTSLIMRAPGTMFCGEWFDVHSLLLATGYLMIIIFPQDQYK